MVALAHNVSGLCVVALSKNLKLPTTLDRAITQNPCYVPFFIQIMTQEQIDKVYAELAAYEKEIADHNEQVLKTLGKKAQRDFEELLDCCNVTEKIEIVDAPKGHDNKENCGVFKNVHVEQWTTNMEGDSYAGFIYANINGQWIKVPFSC